LAEDHAIHVAAGSYEDNGLPTEGFPMREKSSQRRCASRFEYEFQMVERRSHGP